LLLAFLIEAAYA